jgi:signal transduction histidine kinase
VIAMNAMGAIRSALEDCANPRQPPSRHKEAAFSEALAVVARDLHGPLTNLGLLIELLQTLNRHPVHQLAPAAGEAQDVVRDLDGIIFEILERTRTTGEPLGFRPGLVDVRDLFEKAVTLNWPTAEARAVSLINRTERPVIINGDRQLLLKSLDTLMTNAIKLSAEGGDVVCEAESRRGLALISIAADGEGLSELDLARAFRPFATISTGPHRTSAPSDLRLWMVRLIAERHGGRIDAGPRSDGSGTVFKLRLPAHFR